MSCGHDLGSASFYANMTDDRTENELNRLYPDSAAIYIGDTPSEISDEEQEAEDSYNTNAEEPIGCTHCYGTGRDIFGPCRWCKED
jgi:hypothetical protein